MNRQTERRCRARRIRRHILATMSWRARQRRRLHRLFAAYMKELDRIWTPLRLPDLLPYLPAVVRGFNTVPFVRE